MSANQSISDAGVSANTDVNVINSFIGELMNDQGCGFGYYTLWIMACYCDYGCDEGVE